MPLANRHVTTDKSVRDQTIVRRQTGYSRRWCLIYTCYRPLYRLCHDTRRYTQIRADRPIVLFRGAHGRACRKTDIMERATVVRGREAQTHDSTAKNLT